MDNDISYVQVSFGFQTAISQARRATYAAHSEAEGYRNGIGLVKLMGRESGFIPAYVSLADNQVNFCLIPEVPLDLERFHPRSHPAGHLAAQKDRPSGMALELGPGFHRTARRPVMSLKKDCSMGEKPDD